MARIIAAGVSAVLASTSICAAQVASFGNPSGCAALREDWDNISDLMVLVTPEEVGRWEQSCPLTNPSYDGKEMRVTCTGEGDEWPMLISLYIDPKRPDVMIYSETDPENKGSVMLVELSRCD